MKLIVLFAVIASLSVATASLSSIAEPLLCLLAPFLFGLKRGLQQGAGHLKAAVQNVGAGLDQGANAAADALKGTVIGAAGTVGHLPGATIGITHAVDFNKGIAGQLDHTILGNPSSNSNGL